MKTLLSDKELENLNYTHNLTHEYLFKVVKDNEAIFIDEETREINLTSYIDCINVARKELKILDN